MSFIANASDNERLSILMKEKLHLHRLLVTLFSLHLEITGYLLFLISE